MRQSNGVFVSAPVHAGQSVRWLKLLTILSIAVPLFIYLVVGIAQYFSARDDAAVKVARSLRVAHEHASKVLAASEALEAKVLVLVTGRSEVELRLSEPQLHEALRAYTVDQPQIQSILILDAKGKSLASSRLQPFPVTDFSDGEYFRIHQQGFSGSYVSKPIVTRTSGERVLNLSIPFKNEDGGFGGVINIALLASYFSEYYADSVADEPGLAVLMFHEGGELYTRWPFDERAKNLAPTGPVMTRANQGEESAHLRGISSITGEDSFLAYRKVGRYPLYVSTGMSLIALRSQVLRDLAILFALGSVPVAALFFTAAIALRNARTSLQTMESLEREIETRRRAEEALLQAQKLEALGRLTGGVAHDFNNALMVISNNLHLLKRTAPGVGAKQIESMTRAVKSAANLTRQLLAFSRRQPLVSEHVVLQDRLPPISDLIQPALGSRIRLHVSVDDGTAPVMLDLAELELSLLNLAINARDAMQQGGSLTIHARNATESEAGAGAPAMVVIEVMDTGSGIAPEVLGKVFEPFFTTKAVGEGTGLGLSQVYGMCQRMNGRAELSSEVGVGTQVRLFFPASHVQQQEGVLPDTVLSPVDKTLLLVEDNDEVAASLVPILEAMGCQVSHVDRADKARELLDRGEGPDIVLSDVVMPGEMNGIALAQYIRTRWPGQSVLLMTGYAEQLDHIKTLGFKVLPKPCSPRMLHSALQAIASAA